MSTIVICQEARCKKLINDSKEIDNDTKLMPRMWARAPEHYLYYMQLEVYTAICFVRKMREVLYVTKTKQYAW